jgi:hypothetical protein
VVQRAVAAGAREVRPVREEHRWLLGRIEDPFGHHWEIGWPLIPWPPAGGGPRRERRAGRVSGLVRAGLLTTGPGVAYCPATVRLPFLDQLPAKDYGW